MDKIIENLEIIDITEEGKGVAKASGRVYFVENASLGEVIDAKITKEKKNFIEAAKKRTLKQSPYFVEPICPFFENCDGCKTMNLSYEKELELKVQMVKDKLERIGKTKVDDCDIIKCPSRKHFRNKIELKVNEEGKLGYYLLRSHSLVSIDKCIVAGENTNKLIPILEEEIKELGLKGYDRKSKSGEIKNITIRENKFRELQVTLTLSELNKKVEKLFEKLMGVENIIELHYSINKDPRSEIMKNTILVHRKREYKDSIDNLQFKISPRSFFQTNSIMTGELYKEAVRQMNLTGEEKLLDLYCGIGSTTLYFAKYSKEVIGVEVVKDAVDDANLNAELNEIDNVKFILGKSEDKISKYLKDVDILVVDPPRKGLDKKVVEEVSKSNIEKIMYISCNPSTLARDVALFKEIGFEIKEVKLVDMFSNNLHCEMICLLKRKMV